MSEVLYRKWRPGTMSTLVGQDHITHTLKQGIIRDRLAHAYLFCGPRGTGKTSTARILAKAVNCLSPIDGEPDNTCHICLAINESRSLDLIEIDGASNRRIADVRDLTEKIRYSPAESRFKVYIIDEVHMLTNEAFNALLKTLEEPPPHALLILATTEVEKIPLTIVSRCQRFDFRRIPVSDICQKLRNLCASENVNVEESALELIANKCTGSLRDAENILEQVMVTFGKDVTERDIRDLLHLGEDFSTTDLLDEIISGQPGDTIRSLIGLITAGHEPKQVKDNLLDLVRNLILHISGVDVLDDVGQEMAFYLKDKNDEISVSKLVYVAKIISGIDFRNSITNSLPLEIALSEAAISFSANSHSSGVSISQLERNLGSSKVPKPKEGTVVNAPKLTSPKAIVPDKLNRTSATYSRPSPKPNPEQQPVIRTGVNGELDEKWNELLRGLRQTGNRFNIGALLRGCVSKTIDDDSLIFFFRHSSHVERIKSEIENPAVLNQFKEIVSEVLGERYEIKVELSDNSNGRNGKSASQNSHLVRAAQSLGAQIVEEREKIK